MTTGLGRKETAGTARTGRRWCTEGGTGGTTDGDAGEASIVKSMHVPGAGSEGVTAPGIDSEEGCCSLLLWIEAASAAAETRWRVREPRRETGRWLKKPPRVGPRLPERLELVTNEGKLRLA